MYNRTTLQIKIEDPQVALTALEAAAGYGKTVLLNQLASQPGHVLISLADTDPDPVSIAGLFHQRLQTVFGVLPQSRLAYDLQKPSTSPAAIAAAVRHDLLLYASQLQVPLTILLDNAEILNNEGRLFFLSYLLGAPELTGALRIRWIIAMRTEHDLPVRSLRLKMAVQEITTRELALSDVEMRQLGLTEAQCARTAGWPAAVMLASLGNEPEDAARAILFTMPEALLPSLRRASLLKTWRNGDSTHTVMQLRDGWLADARSHGLPCQQLADGTFEVHTIMREVLESELRSRPDEYAAARRALAETLRFNQPMMAVESYLEAGDDVQAQIVLNELLPTLQSNDQIASALPLLLRFTPAETSPMYLALAEALFDAGRMSEGLRRAEIALESGADPATVLAVLGRMRMRTGNMDLAARYLTQALSHPLPSDQAMLLRAQLALALALHARATNPYLNSQAELHAHQVVAHASNKAQSFSTAELLARTALVVTNALRGMRDHAHHQAVSACATVQALSASKDILLALMQLARFYADEGQHARAAELVEQARVMHASARDSDSSLLITLTRAHLHLRTGQADRAAAYATQASQLAVAQMNIPAHREALLILALTGVLPVSNATVIRSNELLRHFGSDPAISASEMILMRVFFRGAEVAEKWRGDTSLPLEVRTLLAVQAVCTNPADALWLAELLDLRQRMGLAAITGYARMLGQKLPSRFTATTLRIEAATLQTTPTFTINGQPFEVRASLIAPLLLLISKGTVTTREVEELVGSEYSESVRRAALSHLRTALKEASGQEESVPSARGTLDLSSWSRHSDLNQLDYANFGDLEALYAAPVYAARLGQPLMALDALRSQAREKLHVRFRQWLLLDAALAQRTWERLQQVDPQLGVLTPAPVGVGGQ